MGASGRFGGDWSRWKTVHRDGPEAYYHIGLLLPWGPRCSSVTYSAFNNLGSAARFEMSAPAISRHLSVLENAGLISGEKRGQYIVYKLNSDSLVNTLSRFAFSICPVGAPLKRESKAKKKAVDQQEAGAIRKP